MRDDTTIVDAPPAALARYKLTKPAFMRATPSAMVTALSPGAEIETDVAPSAHWLPLNDAARAALAATRKPRTGGEDRSDRIARERAEKYDIDRAVSRGAHADITHADAVKYLAAYAAHRAA